MQIGFSNKHKFQAKKISDFCVFNFSKDFSFKSEINLKFLDLWFTSVVIIKKGENVSSICVLMITDNCKHKLSLSLVSWKTYCQRQTRVLGSKLEF